MQKLRPLTEDQRSLIQNSLLKAAAGDRKAAKAGRACDHCQDRPGKDGLGKPCKFCAGTGTQTPHENASLERLAWTLDHQADEAEKLYDLIENADSVQVSQ